MKGGVLSLNLNYLEKLDIFKIRKSSRKIYLCDIESNAIQFNDVTEEFNREDLYRTNYFIKYYGHELGSTVHISIFKIVDRIIDEKNNLIVFYKEEGTKTFER